MLHPGQLIRTKQDSRRTYLHHVLIDGAELWVCVSARPTRPEMAVPFHHLGEQLSACCLWQQTVPALPSLIRLPKKSTSSVFGQYLIEPTGGAMMYSIVEL
jgi:hypothetical protein